jgi:hypothetical protein
MEGHHACTRSLSKHSASSEEAIELIEQFLEADLPALLVEALPALAFEAGKDAMNVCCALLWSGLPRGLEQQVIEYFRDHRRFGEDLIKGHGEEATALHCGVVLRSCVRHQELATAFMEQNLVLDLLRLCAHPSMEVSADAVASLRAILLEHPPEAVAWIVANSHQFFKLVNGLLASGNYVVERQALSLLSKMLLDRQYQKVMFLYVGDHRHLQIVMNLLKEASSKLPLDAFNIFKLFVANPNRPHRVEQILKNNWERLIALLEILQKPGDAAFCREQEKVIELIRQLGSSSSPCAKSVPTACKSSMGIMAGGVTHMPLAIAI